MSKTSIFGVVSGSIAVDTALSATSSNPVQNQIIKAALDEKADSASLSAVATSGSYNDLVDKPTIPSAVTVDSALSDSSENPIQNKVINSALAAKQDTLTAGDNITIADNVISASGLSLKAGLGLKIYPPGTEVINFKNSNCTITSKVATGNHSNQGIIDLELHPLYQNYDTWEYRLEYTHSNTYGASYSILIGHRNDYIAKGLVLLINASNDNFRVGLVSKAGFDSITFDLGAIDLGLAAVNGTTYYIKFGFDGSKYYFEYNTTGWTDTFAEAWSLSTTTKVYNNPYWYTTNGTDFYGGRITLLGEVIETGYNNGSINLATFKFIADGVTVFEPYQTDTTNTILKVVTE